LSQNFTPTHAITIAISILLVSQYKGQGDRLATIHFGSDLPVATNVSTGSAMLPK